MSKHTIVECDRCGDKMFGRNFRHAHPFYIQFFVHPSGGAGLRALAGIEIPDICWSCDHDFSEKFFNDIRKWVNDGKEK